LTGTIATDSLLDGARLRDAFAVASAHLRDLAPDIDAINVYPVPDGDTGSNMSATLREAVARTFEVGDEPRLSQVLAALARGALYGARGNSGVILSQALRGFALGVGERTGFDAAALASGLGEAATSAYRAVSQPAEGTMLTVLRIAGETAQASVAALPGSGAGVPCERLLRKVIAAAEAAEAATMEQLPALKEAGVPDAGGEGVCVILRGLLAGVSGGAPVVRSAVHRPIAMHSEHATDAFGSCTEFVIEPDRKALDLDRMRAVAGAGSNTSVVVVGDETLARVHAHSSDPEKLLAAASALGRLSRVKVEDMDAQNVRFRATGSGAGSRVGVVALSRGAGFDEIFRGLGAAVSDLGEVVKPPAGEIAEAVDALGMADVIVLPNHKNVLLAAQQAAALARSTLHVVPSDSLPQGIAALIAFDPNESAAVNARTMTSAMAGVRTIEVTTAAATRRADGLAVCEGDVIALVDGKLVAAKPVLLDALLPALREAGAGSAGLITLYGGEALPAEELDRIRGAVAQAFGAEVQAHSGGQPLYQLIASVEA
jgi:DAK2 domain fusion protein YloV